MGRQKGDKERREEKGGGRHAERGRERGGEREGEYSENISGAKELRSGRGPLMLQLYTDLENIYSTLAFRAKYRNTNN